MKTSVNSSTVGPIKSKADLGALLDILAPTFGFSREQGEGYTKIVGRENYRIIRRGRTIVGGCAMLPLGQFFGGRGVPMIGIAAVGIAPEHRGQRTATELMIAAVKETHKRGIPISTLYPATLPLYRSVGYEQAGGRYEIRLPAKPLLFRQRESDIELRVITSRDDKAVRETYRQHAVHTPGFLDRSDFIWHRVKSPRGLIARGVMAINSRTNKPEGYAYTLQKENQGPSDGSHSPFSLHATDLVALTPAAGRRLLCFFADHRSMIDQVIWNGHPDDAILKLLPERNYTAKLLDHWMLRIVDVRAALTARGYPSTVETEIHLRINGDDIIPNNNGNFILRVSQGRAAVSAGGRGDVTISIRGLAALFSGHLSSYALCACGELSQNGEAKDSEAAIAALASVFACAAPRLGDMF